MNQKSLGSSPWGSIQNVSRVDTGISVISTAGHGGLRLSHGPYSRLSDYSRERCIELHGYYFLEKDCDMSLGLLELVILGQGFNKDTSDLKIHGIIKNVSSSHPAHFKKQIEDRKIDLKTFINEADVPVIMSMCEMALIREQEKLAREILKTKHPERYVSSRLALKYSDNNHEVALWTSDNKTYIASLTPPPQNTYDLDQYAKVESLDDLLKPFENNKVVFTHEKEFRNALGKLDIQNIGLVDLIIDRAKSAQHDTSNIQGVLLTKVRGDGRFVDIEFQLVDSEEDKVIFNESRTCDVVDLKEIKFLKKIVHLAA